MSVNKVILKGRLGNDPENNSGVVKFSVATSEKYTKKDTGEKVEKTQWHNIVAFSKLGEILQKYFKKGDEIFLIGKINYNEHEGKYYTSIVVDEFDFVGSSYENKKTEESAKEQTNNKQDNSNKEIPEDDLPF